MFQHFQVQKTRRVIEIDNQGKWTTVFEVVTKGPLNNQHTTDQIVQAAVNWAATANENWDKLRLVEGDNA